MSPRAIGIGVAALMAALWTLGAIKPPHPLHWTSLDLRWYFFPLYEAFYGALRAGAPMIWNPYQLCGVPLLGTLPRSRFQIRPTAISLSTHGITSSSTTESGVDASIPRTSVAFRVSGMRIWTSCAYGGSET